MAEIEYVGPFERHEVIVEGHLVPLLSATPLNGGRVHLNLDGRFGIDLTLVEAERVVPFLADCIAVALGFSCHPRRGSAPRQRNPFPAMHGIEWVEETS